MGLGAEPEVSGVLHDARAGDAVLISLFKVPVTVWNWLVASFGSSWSPWQDSVLPENLLGDVTVDSDMVSAGFDGSLMLLDRMLYYTILYCTILCYITLYYIVICYV